MPTWRTSGLCSDVRLIPVCQTETGLSATAARKDVGYSGPAMLQILAVIHVILSISLVGLILMHSGRDTGFGGMGFTPASQGGTHIVERNLTRLTVVVAIVFFANTVALFHLLK
jgi:preprotein translocase subunit SecG